MNVKTFGMRVRQGATLNQQLRSFGALTVDILVIEVWPFTAPPCRFRYDCIFEVVPIVLSSSFRGLFQVGVMG